MQTDKDIVNTIILHEGGRYTNDPADAGGPTRWGITMPVLAAHRKRTVTAHDIRLLTRAEAEDIYTIRFVRPFDGISGTLRTNVIDMGVNAGQQRAIILLQQTIGVTVDGRLGPLTVAATTTRDWNIIYGGVRILFYENLILSKPVNIKWRNGWRNRAISFITPQLRRGRVRLGPSQEPVFGFMGKAV